MMIVALMVLLLVVISVSAQEVCEYNGLKTEYGYNYQAPGAKSEYGNEKFVHLIDPKVIKKLELLKGLTCLESADFYNQGISGNLESLKDLTSLKVLSLHTNPDVSGDVCVFGKTTKLKSLKLAFDEKIYGDISCLKDLNLDTFAMTCTKISGDLSDLSHMTNLKALYLGGTDVTGDVSALSGLTNLEELTLSDAEVDGQKFYGDLSSLDNLKKLRRIAIYNTKATNCQHFHEMHPNIEGGCSEESKSRVIDTNLVSEKIIGKEVQNNAPKDQGPKNSPDGGPPGECIVNKKFIGEEACRTLVDKTSSKKSSSDGPPKECIINGKFIGEDKCKALMDKTSPMPSEKPELTETAVKKSFLKRMIDWLSSLFN